MLNTEHKTALGILMNQDLGRDDAVRKTQGLLNQLEAKLIKKAFPSNYAVRGDIVAIDSLIQALLQEGTMNTYEVFSHPAYIDNLNYRMRAHWKVKMDQVRVNPTSALLDGLGKFNLIAMLTPTFPSVEAFRFRESIAAEILPVISLSHNFSLHPLLYDAFLRILLTNTYPCDSIVCTSRASQAAMSCMLKYVSEHFNSEFGTSLAFSGRLDRIPLCVDTAKFRPLDKVKSRRQFGFHKDEFILLYLGRISPLKADLYPLLSVFRSLVQKNDKRKLILVIAGTKHEPYATGLQEFIKAQSLEKCVRLVSDVPDQDKAALYSASDIFVAPTDSVQESFGISPIEAMACGIPQVASDWDGYRDTISHGETGFLVPTYWTECDRDLRDTGSVFGPQFDHLCLGQSIVIDLVALRAFLQIIIDNEDLRRDMSERSRKRAEALFSYRTVAVQYEELAHELSCIGSGLVIHKATKTFATPQYFKFFRNHASSIIEDDCVLTLTSLDQEAHGRSILSSLRPLVQGTQILDSELVHCAIEQLRRGVSGKADGLLPSAVRITLRGLVDVLSQGRNHPEDFIRRNVMWLIKQGFVTISVGGATQPTEVVPTPTSAHLFSSTLPS